MSKKKNNLAFLADFNPSSYEVNETGQNPTTNSKKNSFVVKSVFEYSRKRFSKTAIRENFQPKT